MKLSDYVLGERLLQKFGGKDWREDAEFDTKRTGHRYDYWERELAKIVPEPAPVVEEEEEEEEEGEEEEEEEGEGEEEEEEEGEEEEEEEGEGEEEEEEEEGEEGEEFTHWLKTKNSWVQVKGYEPARVGEGGNGGLHKGTDENGAAVTARGKDVAKTNDEYEAYRTKLDAAKAKKAKKKEEEAKKAKKNNSAGESIRQTRGAKARNRRKTRSTKGNYMEEGMIDE